MLLNSYIKSQCHASKLHINAYRNRYKNTGRNKQIIHETL